MPLRNYVAFDGVPFPDPVSGTLDVQTPLQDAEQATEDGHTQRNVIRTGRHVISAEWELSPAWLKRLASVCSRDAVELTCFIPDLGATGTVSCFCSSGFSPKVEEGSERLAGVSGIWKVSLTFTEY